MDLSRLQKLKKLRRFLLLHLLFFGILMGVGYALSFLAGIKDAFHFSFLTFSLVGVADYSYKEYSIAQHLLSLALTEAGIFWQLFWQFRVIHILMPQSKTKAYTWKCLLTYSFLIQLIAFLVLLVFWKPEVTSTAGIPYVFNAAFQSVMLIAGSQNHFWPGQFVNPALKDLYLLQLAITGIFLLSAAGSWLLHDVANLHRLRARLKWPKRNWTVATRLGLWSMGAIFIAVSILIDTQESALVTRWIHNFFNSAGLWDNFVLHPVRFWIISKIIGTPLGSPIGNGLLALIMLWLIAPLRRYFGRNLVYYAIVLFFLILIMWTSLFYMNLLFIGIFIWIAKIPIILLRLTQSKIRPSSA